MPIAGKVLWVMKSKPKVVGLFRLTGDYDPNACFVGVVLNLNGKFDLEQNSLPSILIRLNAGFCQYI